MITLILYEHNIQVFNELEHIYNHCIGDDGHLVIQVPNNDSIERKLFGRKWFSFDVPRHLWHFNESSLKNFLRRCRYDTVAVYKRNAFFHPVTIAASLYREADPQRIWLKHTRNKNLKIIAWIFLTILSIPFSFIQNMLGRGSMLTVIAKKRRLK